MFLSEPGHTRFDLNFSMFGFPVRVHPAFFIMPLLLGSGFLRSDAVNAGVALIILSVVFFVSILVHELGHAFAMRYYGQSPRILIYWMGGLAISDGGVWGARRATAAAGNQKIIISLAGPVFGFALALFLVVLVYLMSGSVELNTSGLIPFPEPIFAGSIIDGLPDTARSSIWMAFLIGLWANVFWNVLNLVPVFPLDGGQIARELFVMNNPWNGVQYSVMLSIGAAVLIALFGFSSGQQFLGFFFAFMAWNNYQTLQQFGGGSRPW